MSSTRSVSLKCLRDSLPRDLPPKRLERAKSDASFESITESEDETDEVTIFLFIYYLISLLHLLYFNSPELKFRRESQYFPILSNFSFIAKSKSFKTQIGRGGT